MGTCGHYFFNSFSVPFSLLSLFRVHMIIAVVPQFPETWHHINFTPWYSSYWIISTVPSSRSLTLSFATSFFCEAQPGNFYFRRTFPLFKNNFCFSAELFSLYSWRGYFLGHWAQSGLSPLPVCSPGSSEAGCCSRVGAAGFILDIVMLRCGDSMPLVASRVPVFDLNCVTLSLGLLTVVLHLPSLRCPLIV